MTTMDVIPKHAHSGAVDALVNYYLTKIRLADEGDKTAPEFDLKREGASEAFYAYLRGRGKTAIDQDIAFELAMNLASIVSRNPFDAEGEIRAVLERAIERLDYMDRIDAEIERAQKRP